MPSCGFGRGRPLPVTATVTSSSRFRGSMLRPPPFPLIVPFLLFVLAPADTLAAAAEPPAPYTQSIPGTDVSFVMVPVPGGRFTMGSPPRERGRDPDEGEPFTVEVEPFHIGRCEVTCAEYDLFARRYMELAAADRRPRIPRDRLADAVTYPTPLYELEAGPMIDRRGGRSPEMPAVFMSQFDARQYTKWLSKKTGRFYRLPTEAEWEYACRAGTKTAYSFGNDPRLLGDYAWYVDNSDAGNGENTFHPPGRKKPNAWGLYDMHGNVAEWCIDQYDPGWYWGFDPEVPVKAADAINWPNRKHPRVIRGGSFQHEAAECRSAARVGSTKQEVDMHNVADMPESPHWSTLGTWIGFRVVSPVKEPTEAEKRRFWDADDAVTRAGVRRDRTVRELVEPPPPDGARPPRK